MEQKLRAETKWLKEQDVTLSYSERIAWHFPEQRLNQIRKWTLDEVMQVMDDMLMYK